MTQPIINVRDKDLSISVFEKQTNDGKNYYAVCLQRSYKKKGEEEWTRDSINLFSADLLRISALANRAYNDILEAQEKKGKTATKEPDNNYEDNDEIPFN